MLVSVLVWVCKYRVIQEEIGDSIGHCGNKSSYERVKSHMVTEIERSYSAGLTTLGFRLWG